MRKSERSLTLHVSAYARLRKKPFDVLKDKKVNCSKVILANNPKPYIEGMKKASSQITHAGRIIILLACIALMPDRFNAFSQNRTEGDSIISKIREGLSPERESLFPDKSKSLANSHFTWGAEAGTSIDLTANDMSTFDVDVHFGYKNKWFQMLGVGAGIHRSVKSGDNFIPVYASIQTSFRPRPSLLFLSIKAGYSFNTISESPMFGDLVSAIGCGVNLSHSKVAQTYIILSAGYRYFNRRHIEMIDKINTHYTYLAHLSFGVSF